MPTEPDFEPLFRARYRSLFLGLFTEEQEILTNSLQSAEEAAPAQAPYNAWMQAALGDAAAIATAFGGPVALGELSDGAVTLKELVRRTLWDSACGALAYGFTASDLHSLIDEAEHFHTEDLASGEGVPDGV